MRPANNTFNEQVNYNFKYTNNTSNSNNSNSSNNISSVNQIQNGNYLNTKLNNNKEIKILPNHYNNYGEEALAKYRLINENNKNSNNNNYNNIIGNNNNIGNNNKNNNSNNNTYISKLDAPKNNTGSKNSILKRSSEIIRELIK